MELTGQSLVIATAWMTISSWEKLCSRCCRYASHHGRSRVSVITSKTIISSCTAVPLARLLPSAGARVKAVMPPNRRDNSSRTTTYFCASKGCPSLFATGNRISTRCTVHLQLGSSRCQSIPMPIVFREEHLPNGGGWKARPGLDRRRHLNEATCRLPQTRKQGRFEWHKQF